MDGGVALISDRSPEGRASVGFLGWTSESESPGIGHAPLESRHQEGGAQADAGSPGPPHRFPKTLPDLPSTTRGAGGSPKG